jgi:ADP-ribose pyrophosphatase YjhB (NUDIX family)
MVRKKKICPHCGKELLEYQNPVPTVDIIIESEPQRIILIKRKNHPYGWALPGGFVDYGETVEQAAVREAKEETSLSIESLRLFGVYSDPARDPRHHTLSIVFIAQGRGTPQAADDAEDLGVFPQSNLPAQIVFDHDKILQDYFRMKMTDES